MMVGVELTERVRVMSTEFIYNGLDGLKMVVTQYAVYKGKNVLVANEFGSRASFTEDQYTGFIQQEFIRLVESGAIPKPPTFPRNCPECGEISVELHAEGCRYV